MFRMWYDDYDVPSWPFLCEREKENARLERLEKMGQIPAFDAAMDALAEGYGRIAADGKGYLAKLSDSSDDERKLATIQL
jgi:hypothetical protein